MICFPNAKINLGLQIVEKRKDGFHNIETVFYPVNWCDVLECTTRPDASTKDELCKLITSGLPINGSPGDNILVKAYHLISLKKKLPPVDVYLHKAIPMGAGLGGGSADAAFLMKMLNQLFSIGLSNEMLKEEAAKLGSDCTFFIENVPVYAKGKGDELETLDFSLKGYQALIIYPGIHSDTKLAYSRVQPKPGRIHLKDFIQNTPVEQWKDFLVNDFEESVFYHYPEIISIKEELYKSGALYVSLSGSGSAVFGIFRSDQAITPPIHPNYKVFVSAL